MGSLRAASRCRKTRCPSKFSPAVRLNAGSIGLNEGSSLPQKWQLECPGCGTCPAQLSRDDRQRNHAAGKSKQEVKKPKKTSHSTVHFLRQRPTDSETSHIRISIPKNDMSKIGRGYWKLSFAEVSSQAIPRSCPPQSSYPECRTPQEHLCSTSF